MNGRSNRKLAEALSSNWQAEMRGYHTYSTLADRDDEPHRKTVLRGLASAEKHHAQLWANRMKALGIPLPQYNGPKTGDADSLAARVGGDQLELRRLELDESRDIARYGKQLRELGDAESIAILDEVISDEKDHYNALGHLIRGRRPAPQVTTEEAQRALDELIAARDAGKPRAGSWIGDAIYGVNDGLGAIFGIVSGVSGATLGNSHFVLIAGLAGMIASALSMGSGAYLAAKSEREIYEAEYAREQEAVSLNEAEARELLTLSYQVRGLDRDDAERFVEHIASDRKRLVNALARERLDTTEEGLTKPWVSAVSGALSTAVGAFIPIIPFFFTSGYTAVVIAGIVSLAAHFAVGAAKSLITIRSWWSSGLEMTLIGAVEGAVTYAIGLGLGHIGGGGPS
jgi:VIT1/CCC1 family predicted Fe2+/Mn2+ transporter/rubrerythrin